MLLLTNNKREKSKFLKLCNILNTISASNDIKELLGSSLNKILKALDSERGSIFLLGDDGKELLLKWSYNLDSALKEMKKKLGEGVVGKVAMDRIPMLVKDVRSDVRFNGASPSNGYKTNSFLSVPISTDMKLIGVINITENKHKKPYSEKDLKFLKVIADHMALKIERIYLLSELEQLKQKMEKEGKFTDLGKFASGLSHELNNPLDGVIRYVNLALGSLEQGVAREYLLEAKGGLKRITDIIRSLLELVRRKKLTTPAFVDVNKVIESLLDGLRVRAMYKSIDIRKDFSSDLPMVPDLGLESVFSNIFRNALDALEEKGSIDVTTSCENGFVEVTVSDTGCGISKDNVDRIFDPFFTTKEMTKGTGLGLSICYDIIKRYNGKIDVSSEPGKGSKFTVSIPHKGKK